MQPTKIEFISSVINKEKPEIPLICNSEEENRREKKRINFGINLNKY